MSRRQVGTNCELENPLLDDEEDNNSDSVSSSADSGGDEDGDVVDDDDDAVALSRAGITLQPYLDECRAPATAGDRGRRGTGGGDDAPVIPGGRFGDSRSRSRSRQDPSAAAAAVIAASKAGAAAVAEAPPRNHYTPLTATVFTINYIVGVGSLGIPNAFLKGGTVLGVLTVAVAAATTYITINWVCETVVRAAKLALLPCEASRGNWMCTKAHDHDPSCLPDLPPEVDASTTVTAAAAREELRVDGDGDCDAGAAAWPRLAVHTPADAVEGQDAAAATPSPGSPCDLEDSFAFDDCCDRPGASPGGPSSRETAVATATHSRSSSSSPPPLLQRPRLKRRMTPRTQAWRKTQFVDPIDIEWKSFEVVSLCQKFFGEPGKRLYQVALVLLMYVGLLGYAQVFGSSLLAELDEYAPQWDVPPIAVQIAFALVVIPLSCLELSEQICVQLSMGALNLLILLFMAGCSFWALYGDVIDNLPPANASGSNATTAALPTTAVDSNGLAAASALRDVLRRHLLDALQSDGDVAVVVAAAALGNTTATTREAGPAGTTTGTTAAAAAAATSPLRGGGGPPHETPFAVPLVDLSGFGLMLSTGVMSLLCQHSVPGLIQPLDKRFTSRKRVGCVFGVAIATVSLMYVVLGLSTVYYFGGLVKPSININWEGFRFGVAHDTTVPLALRIVAAAVVLFPVLNTPVIFPLIAITLGNNLEASMPPWAYACLQLNEAGVWHPSMRIFFGRFCISGLRRRKEHRGREHPEGGGGGGGSARSSRSGGAVPRVVTTATAEACADAGTAVVAVETPGATADKAAGPGTPVAVKIDQPLLTCGAGGSNANGGGRGYGTASDRANCADGGGGGNANLRRHHRHHHHDHHGHHRVRTPEEKKHRKRLVRLNRVLFRVCAAVPPLLLSVLNFDLSVTLQLAGIPAIFVALVTPALLQHRSKRTARRQFRHSTTKYSWHFSHDAYVYAVLVLSAGILVVVIIESVQLFLPTAA